MYLNINEKEQIQEEIKTLETKSSAELVAVITKYSSSYRFETLVFSLLISVFISIILLFADIDTIKFFQIQVLSFFALFFLTSSFKKILLTFLPKKYKYEKASINAKKEFYNLGIKDTKTKLGIMFYVSIEEKYVEIITDTGIKSKISDNYWQDIVNEFIKDVKNNQFSIGYKKAIKECSETLIKSFPIQDNDKNELSNEVIEL
ncbi:TPM domain-containing protein [Halarcobacter sp.]|uniref:TPM domain-containing protein n=1 Tax=Halarcobacter sp. TaxID=2321133 RepID=UPI002AA8C917|nr:TPM domain-containing protein [Halarcobacter sp.]